MFSRSAGSIVLALATILTVSGAAQQTVPFRGTTPVAPNGIPAVPLPDKPLCSIPPKDRRSG